SSAGTTGRSLTTVSSPFFCERRARTTSPTLSSARSGVSKKKTCRSCACSGSSPNARAVDSCAGSGTVSFSSTLSVALIRLTSSSSTFSVGALTVGIDRPFGMGSRRFGHLVTQRDRLYTRLGGRRVGARAFGSPPGPVVLSRLALDLGARCAIAGRGLDLRYAGSPRHSARAAWSGQPVRAARTTNKQQQRARRGGLGY